MCPKCRTRMFSSWCYACASCWEVLVYAPPAPDPVAYTRPRRERTVGMGSRCLSLDQREAAKLELAEGSPLVRVASKFFIGVATAQRMREEMREV